LDPDLHGRRAESIHSSAMLRLSPPMKEHWRTAPGDASHPNLSKGKKAV
jgi:hypothetical protein